MKYFLFIISIAIVLSSLVLGLRYFLIGGESSLDKKESVYPSASTPSSEGSVHRVQEVPDAAISTVTYSQDKFSPALVKIGVVTARDKHIFTSLAPDESKLSPVDSLVNIKSESVESGCLLTIVNTSDRPLTIRLSPHDPKDEWGFLYPVIPAGEKSIIDPRYRIPEIVFHNHEKPDEEFEVILAKGCL